MALVLTILRLRFAFFVFSAFLFSDYFQLFDPNQEDKISFCSKKNQYFVIFYSSYLLIDCTKFLIIINES